MSDLFSFNSSDETATSDFGAAIAGALPASAVIALIGPLGAGKTRLVQAIARAAGIDEGVVASPTFVLVHEYAGRVPIYHFDAYRLRDENEFAALGPEEYFARQGWSLIEWADRVANCLPPERLEIVIEPTGPASRRFTIQAFGQQYESAVAELERRLAAVAKKKAASGD